MSLFTLDLHTFLLFILVGLILFLVLMALATLHAHFAARGGYYKKGSGGGGCSGRRYTLYDDNGSSMKSPLIRSSSSMGLMR